MSITDIPTAVADPAGRKPAPGRLGVVQAFLNTVPLRTGGPDLLGDRRAAIGWFRAVGILPTDPVVVTSSEHANLLRLRELLRAVLMTRTAGRWPPLIETTPTPGSWDIFCATRVSAMSSTLVSGMP